MSSAFPANFERRSTPPSGSGSNADERAKILQSIEVSLRRAAGPQAAERVFDPETATLRLPTQLQAEMGCPDTEALPDEDRTESGGLPLEEPETAPQAGTDSTALFPGGLEREAYFDTLPEWN